MPLGEPRVLLHNKRNRGGDIPLRIHLVQKNAHSAIASAFVDLHHLRDKVMDFASTPSDDDRMMVVRHPADRAVSAWSFFCWKNPDGNLQTFMQAMGYSKQMEWNKFFEVYIENFRKDIHTRPQVDFLAGQEVKHLVPIERLSDWWKEWTPYYKLPTLNHTNRSNHEPWKEVVSPEQCDEIETKLHEDVELYRRSLNAPNKTAKES